MHRLISILLSLFLLNGCSIHNQDSVLNISDSNRSNEGKIVFINDSLKIKYITDHFSSFWIANETQLKVIDSILYSAIKQKEDPYYKRLKLDSIDTYYRQYVCFTESNGDSIVFINALCRIPEKPVTDEYNKTVWQKADWKNEIIHGSDGGDCYWRIWINLTKKCYYKFMVNGIA